MPNDCSVVADPAAGIAIVAGRRVPMQADAASGAIRFGGAAGSLLRPLAFAERTEVVSESASLAFARDAVAAAVLRAATVERGTGETTLLEVLAMWLAGAAWDAPAFDETTLLVARAAGWTPHELFSAPAREVDRLAVHLDEARQASDWKAIVFAERPAESVEEVRTRFADRLLRRAWSAAAEPQLRTAAAEPQLSTAAAEPPLSGAAAPPRQGREEGTTAGPRHGREAGTTAVSRAAAAPPHSRAAASPPQSGAAAAPPLSGTAAIPPHTAGEVEDRQSCLSSGGAGQTGLSVLHQSASGTRSEELASASALAAGDVRRVAGDKAAAARAASGSTGFVAVRSSAAAAPPRMEAAALPPHSEITMRLERVHASGFDVVTASRERLRLREELAEETDDLAQLLAGLLADEADLRGVER